MLASIFRCFRSVLWTSLSTSNSWLRKSPSRVHSSDAEWTKLLGFWTLSTFSWTRLYGCCSLWSRTVFMSAWAVCRASPEELIILEFVRAWPLRLTVVSSLWRYPPIVFSFIIATDLFLPQDALVLFSFRLQWAIEDFAHSFTVDRERWCCW